jgi:hypothetical protein
MGDHRNQGRQNTHDTGAPETRARDDLRTASRKRHGDQRDDDRDRGDAERPGKDDPSLAPESGDRKATG